MLLAAVTLVAIGVAVVALHRPTGPHPTAAAVEQALHGLPEGSGAATVSCRGGGTSWSCETTEFNGGASWLPVSVERDKSLTVHEEWGDVRTCCVH